MGLEAPDVDDCWVVGRNGRRAGVVTGWLWVGGGWQARVVHTVVIDGRWQLVEEWMPESAVELAS